MTPQQAVDIVRNFKDFIISFQKVHGFAIIDSEDIEAIDTVVVFYEEKSITVELRKKILLSFTTYMEDEMGINIPISIINNYLENN